VARKKNQSVQTKDDRIKKFVSSYIKNFNATEAAIAAGYSKKSASFTGSIMLKEPKVREAIEAAERRFENKIFVSKERIMKELALIGFSSIDEHIDIEDGGLVVAKTFEEMPAGAVRAIKKIKEKRTIRTVKGTADKPDGEEILDSTFEYELYDKPQALINMGKELGMFRDRKDIGLDEKAIELILSFLPKEYADAVRAELIKMTE
jgi:phage terminase small subunit